MENGMNDGIRKGPWKAEEDAVLVCHVRKYGPRDWSSIRSKGLLRRTGKSCRLRWVNKLRPNLKNGCKFSAEEERLVIELQAEFGNKWARIATYLSGRTDNDVKNFWSSRQKRLARILHAGSSPRSRPHKTKRELSSPVFPDQGYSSMSEADSSRKILSCSSSSNENSNTIKMVSLPDLFHPNIPTLEQDLITQPEATVNQAENNLCTDLQPAFSFPQPISQPNLDLGFSESHDLLAKLDPFYDMFGPLTVPKLESGVDLPFGDPFSEQVGSCGSHGRPEFDGSLTPDCFFDDFPVDMFDLSEPLPSPDVR